MASPAVPSIAYPVPALTPGDAHWRDEVADQLARVQREAGLELRSTHPGARHRVATLLALGAGLSAQLAELDASREVRS